MEAEKSSFTSSSNRLGRVGLALAVCAGVLAGYTGLIWAGRVPPGEGVSQAQMNVVRLQRMLEDPTVQPEVVLVGSSIAANLKVQAINPSFLNLGAYGGSSQDGLDVVLKSGKRPKLVIVEMTFWVSRGLDPKLTHTLDDPANRFLYRTFPFVRPEYQPVNVGLSALKRRKSAPNSVPSEAAQKATAENLIKNTNFDTQGKILEDVEWIKTAVAELERRGIRVVFVDLPIDPTIEASAGYAMNKALWHDAIGDESKFARFPGTTALRATDGWHLVRDDAVKVSEWLVSLQNAP